MAMLNQVILINLRSFHLHHAGRDILNMYQFNRILPLSLSLYHNLFFNYDFNFLSGFWYTNLR